MSSLHYTYEDLKKLFSTPLVADLGIAPSSIPNILSALKQFVISREVEETSLIGPTLRGGYFKARDKHLEQLREQERPPEYVSNRKSLLAKCRAVLLEADRRSTSARTEASPFQTALKELIGQRGTIKGTAREAGIPLATLRRWLDGAVPNAATLGLVERLEVLYGLNRGSLTDLLPARAKAGAGCADKDVHIEYRARLKELSASPYALRDAGPDLRAEWRELVHFKTQLGMFKRWAGGVSQTLRRQASGRWKATTNAVETERPTSWYAFHNGMHVPTAGIAWNYISQYLGWLTLPKKEGGLALPNEQAQTLAHLANGQYVEAYVDWKRARSGGIVHNGLTTFLRQVRSLCHPETGYLTQSWSVFGPRVGVASLAQWLEICESCYESVRAKARDFGEVEARSRDPFAPIQKILDLANPLDGVVDAIKRMDANRPTTGGRAEAIWARDRILVLLLVSNPLRKKNLQLLKFVADGKGHLRKVDGVWRIFIPKEEFKNERGAAKTKTYNMPVRRELWADIERYLTIYRPQLADSDNPYFFVSSKSPQGPWKHLARHFAALTKRYFFGCPGVGPHAMRHIVATSILKQRPNDWETAAWVLHDKVETVKKNYAHLRSDDAARWSDPVMAGPFARI